MTDDVWDEVVKGVKRIKTNIHVDEILPKEVEIRQDKEVTVSFDLLKNGSNIAKDDLSHMDGSLAKRFKREAFPVEGILDLHGVTEKDAFDKVCNFIKNSYFSHKRCIIIVTICEEATSTSPFLYSSNKLSGPYPTKGRSLVNCSAPNHNSILPLPASPSTSPCAIFPNSLPVWIKLLNIPSFAVNVITVVTIIKTSINIIFFNNVFLSFIYKSIVSTINVAITAIKQPNVLLNINVATKII